MLIFAWHAIHFIFIISNFLSVVHKTQNRFTLRIISKSCYLNILQVSHYATFTTEKRTYKPEDKLYHTPYHADWHDNRLPYELEIGT